MDPEPEGKHDLMGEALSLRPVLLVRGAYSHRPGLGKGSMAQVTVRHGGSVCYQVLAHWEHTQLSIPELGSWALFFGVLEVSLNLMWEEGIQRLP